MARSETGCDRCAGRHLLPPDFLGTSHDPQRVTEWDADQLITRILHARADIQAGRPGVRDARTLLARLQRAVLDADDNAEARREVMLEALTLAADPLIGHDAGALRRGSVGARHPGVDDLRVAVAAAVIREKLNDVQVSDRVLSKAVKLFPTRSHGKAIAILELADELGCGPWRGRDRAKRAATLRQMLLRLVRTHADRSTKP